MRGAGCCCCQMLTRGLPGLVDVRLRQRAEALKRKQCGPVPNGMARKHQCLFKSSRTTCRNQAPPSFGRRTPLVEFLGSAFFEVVRHRSSKCSFAAGHATATRQMLMLVRSCEVAGWACSQTCCARPGLPHYWGQVALTTNQMILGAHLGEVCARIATRNGRIPDPKSLPRS